MNTLGEEEHEDRLSGFIFLCNGKTKPECYIYRVFGLPEFKKDVVENIKPGMRLFLFDFELKLLYGVYEATSVGTLNVEPTAFGGKFPAQVSFRISQDCLPLPESSFKRAIEDNYQKGKFKQELNDLQVRSLLSLFRPLPLPKSVPLPPSGIDNPFRAQATLLSQNDPSPTTVQLSHNLSVQMPQHLQRFEGQHYAHYGPSSNFHQAVNRQTLPAPTMPYMDNPYAPRTQHVYAPQVLETTCVDQSALSSEPGPYGTMMNTGYVHYSTGLQPLQVPSSSYPTVHTLPVPASSYYYADTQQQAYNSGNPSYYSYGPGMEASYSNQYPGMANVHYDIPLQGNQDIVVHPENGGQDYSSWRPEQNGVQNYASYYHTSNNAP